MEIINYPNYLVYDNKVTHQTLCYKYIITLKIKCGYI